MTRMKLLALSAITAVMIPGSTLVLAVAPADEATADVSADPVSVTTDLAAGPVRRGSGTGRSLKK